MNIQLNSEQNTAYIAISTGEYYLSKKISENVIVDGTKESSVLGIEILDVSEKNQKKTLNAVPQLK